MEALIEPRGIVGSVVPRLVSRETSIRSGLEEEGSLMDLGPILDQGQVMREGAGPVSRHSQLLLLRQGSDPGPWTWTSVTWTSSCSSSSADTPPTSPPRSEVSAS